MVCFNGTIQWIKFEDITEKQTQTTTYGAERSFWRVVRKSNLRSWFEAVELIQKEYTKRNCGQQRHNSSNHDCCFWADLRIHSWLTNTKWCEHNFSMCWKTVGNLHGTILKTWHVFHQTDSHKIPQDQFYDLKDRVPRRSQAETSTSKAPALQEAEIWVDCVSPILVAPKTLKHPTPLQKTPPTYSTIFFLFFLCLGTIKKTQRQTNHLTLGEFSTSLGSTDKSLVATEIAAGLEETLAVFQFLEKWQDGKPQLPRWKNSFKKSKETHGSKF